MMYSVPHNAGSRRPWQSRLLPATRNKALSPGRNHPTRHLNPDGFEFRHLGGNALKRNAKSAGLDSASDEVFQLITLRRGMTRLLKLCPTAPGQILSARSRIQPASRPPMKVPMPFAMST